MLIQASEEDIKTPQAIPAVRLSASFLDQMDVITALRHMSFPDPIPRPDTPVPTLQEENTNEQLPSSNDPIIYKRSSYIPTILFVGSVLSFGSIGLFVYLNKPVKKTSRFRW